jgi:hypothetical protein
MLMVHGESCRMSILISDFSPNFEIDTKKRTPLRTYRTYGRRPVFMRVMINVRAHQPYVRISISIFLIDIDNGGGETNTLDKYDSTSDVTSAHKA